MKKIKRLLATLLVLCLLVSLVTTALALEPTESSNANAQNYTEYGNKVYSYLVSIDNGYMRVEYADKEIVVEYYDNAFNLTEKKNIEKELYSFAGFFNGEDAYYMVFAQPNSEEDDSVEVVRVVKYTKDWERIDAASLYGANTINLSYASSSLRMAESGGYLYVRTGHTMYTSSDGRNHQANLTFALRESDMEIIYSNYRVSNVGTGYVSHSFNQFIIVDDEDNVIALDHGDGYPRAAVLFKYSDKAGSDTFSSSNTHINLVEFSGEVGDNATGASLGGLEYSSSSYLVVGNSVNQDSEYRTYSHRRVFVAVTDRDNFSSDGTTIKWITDSSSPSASTPQLVKISDDEFLLLYTSGSDVYYMFLNADGDVTSETYTAEAKLSDCQPIVTDGQIIWYYTQNSSPYFCRIDLSDPSSIAVDEANTYTAPDARSGFADVSTLGYYYDGMLWAVENGITNGTSSTTFSPNDTCTRGQIITFLWRAVGSPEPESSAEFSDVAAGDYYYKAVQWAHEQGLDSSSGSFEPESACTRATVVEYLYRLAGSPAVTAATDFTDVSAADGYADAVAWAVEQGVTTGTSATTFSPSDTCTRGQIVTFLYRALA
ncbi:MAG: S-layer homology domain-containing protein [Oscillospiraceae bacterium]|nr:S-layer homology domain-containing protein [Oscillospiraceae bacterium]